MINSISRRMIPIRTSTTYGSGDTIKLASKYDTRMWEPFLLISLVGASKSKEINRIFTYESKRKVANASITEALMSQCLLNRT
jgi:hypothetical protein